MSHMTMLRMLDRSVKWIYSVALDFAKLILSLILLLALYIVNSVGLIFVPVLILAVLKNTMAQSVLGDMYYWGVGAAQNHVKAVKWWRKAAEQGNAGAQHNLGVIHRDSTYYIDIEYKHKDFVEAVRWFRQSAEKGHAESQTNLGAMYEHGKGVSQDYSTAVNWYRKAAKQDFANGQINLGLSYENGKGVPQDYKLAYMWYYLAALKGYEKAQKNLDIVAKKMVPSQIIEAQKLATNCFSTKLKLNKAQNLAKFMLTKVFPQSLYIVDLIGLRSVPLQILAGLGNKTAQFYLGDMYQHGYGVVRNYPKAIMCYRKAAAKGVAKAQHDLGVIYRDGEVKESECVPKDFVEAVKWFSQAADQGLAYAQNNLGLMYGEGQGVPQDYAEAAKWYRKAAEQGEVLAQSNLGFSYELGNGVPQDNKLAYMWYNLAALQGNAIAQKKLNIVAKKMTPSQITEAQKLAKAV